MLFCFSWSRGIQKSIFIFLSSWHRPPGTGLPNPVVCTLLGEMKTTKKPAYAQSQGTSPPPGLPLRRFASGQSAAPFPDCLLWSSHFHFKSPYLRLLFRQQNFLAKSLIWTVYGTSLDDKNLLLINCFPIILEYSRNNPSSVLKSRLKWIFNSWGTWTIRFSAFFPSAAMETPDCPNLLNNSLTPNTKLPFIIVPTEW